MTKKDIYIQGAVIAASLLIFEYFFGFMSLDKIGMNPILVYGLSFLIIWLSNVGVSLFLYRKKNPGKK